ncbi:MAG: hypothetical protein RH917_05260 [Lacipirellulaceae bacterium]
MKTLRYAFPLWLLFCSQLAMAQTGTFLDRSQASDLRVVSYNVLWDSIFAENNVFQSAKFERVFTALDPDILNLQEIGNPFCNDCTPKTGEDVRVLLNTLTPLGGDGWQVYQGGTNVIASKYPLSMQRDDTSPAGDRRQAIALVDLPDDQYDSDFYFLNNHYKCCGDVGGFEDQLRQRQSDAIVNWIRDARTPGGAVDLEPGTPFAVVGDLNLVGGTQPLDTLLDGNIINEFTYGADFPPDWDGSTLTDARPKHNVTGSNEYTWRNDNSRFAPGVLDFVVYSDSALDVSKQFILNTVEMSAADRAATGLQQLDVTVDGSGNNYDHLPVVVDFRLFDFADSDFDFSRTVDDQDLAVWQNGYAAVAAALGDGDSDGNSTVDGLDLLAIQRDFTGSSTSLAAVPEPSAFILLLISAVSLSRNRIR